MKKFLKGIELIEEEKNLMMGLEEQKDNEEWSALYYALTAIEKLFVHKHS